MAIILLTFAAKYVLHMPNKEELIAQVEAEQVAMIEKICFPPNEACSEEHMKQRVALAPELFLVAADINLYYPEGKNIMVLGLDVLPEYRNQGLAGELVFQYFQREKRRHAILLTCLDEKVQMYEKMGFVDLGIANSTWGGEEWHEMRYIIK